MKTLFVTGATGLVGSQFVLDAMARGQTVRALVRYGRSSALPGSVGPGAIESVEGDLRDVSTWAKALTGADAVVHAGALVGDSGANEDYSAINVKGTVDLLRAAHNSGTVKRFILISSLGVYPGRDHFGSDESVEISRDGLDAYTRSKAECEFQFLREIKSLGLVGAALRPGFIYGERDRTVVPRLLERLSKKTLVYFGGGDRKTNCIYVRNLTYAINLALEVDPEKVRGLAFNLTDSPSATKREFLEALARESGLPFPSGSIPRAVALTLAEISEFSAKFGLFKSPPVSKAAFKFLGLNLDYSIDRAKTVLGYSPEYGYADGLKKTVSWFRENGMLPVWSGR